MTSEQIKLQIERLQSQLKVAEIAEHKVDLVSVVKSRIKESAKDITPAALEYILSPIRIYLCGQGQEKASKRQYIRWTALNEAMLVSGQHEKLISLGYSQKNISNKANRMGYKFVFGKSLEGKESK